MTKGENTRKYIIKKSAELFNQRGYAGSSLSDITEVTGIKRGGIYRHFACKDEIALEAYDYAVGIVNEKFTEAAKEQQSAIGKIMSLFKVYEQVVEHPPFIGGCPVLNTAVESDDTHPELRKKAQQSIERMLQYIKGILYEGIQNGELKPNLDTDSLATFIFSVLEGGIMLSKLEGNNRHMQFNIECLSKYLEQFSFQSS
ncbi:transcriptional regulator, TetR family [Clostridium acidisoli DSM 12555]|uniref:Transcriptional regulator, TetR family n=1 Tax=Clostridium acidisoli DSM 12555 TaxID=1121291 RepID=A0A1W1XHC8_9CLOT|nr:TetR/AcrR family transcriptional regulator [Clostridium acidisoli]SMC23395.1 transcriptional regulator, TetR family [Clostridium acidisoli DSM 12555]